MEVTQRKDALALGLKKYFTGKPCPKGHFSERYTSSMNCCECNSLIAKSKSKGKKRHFISEDFILSCASISSDYADFRSRFKNECMAASKKGILHKVYEITGHGITSKKWTPELCVLEAKKYSSRSEFARSMAGAYDAAATFGILEECFSHMKRPKCQSDVVYFWGGEVDGMVISKPGVTSSRLGNARVESVMKKYGGSVDFCFLIKTKSAREIEKRILKIGYPANVENINGSAEFRVMTWDQVGKAYAEMMR